MNALVRSHVVPRWWPLLALVLAIVPLQVDGDQTATVRAAANPGATVNTFVIIFRQGPRTLTDAETQRRAEETSVWARGQNRAGHKLEPRILTPEAAYRGPERNRSGDEWPVSALLFLEAADLGGAAKIAEAHPALRYGATVEVRHWAPPVAAPTNAPAARSR